MNNNPSNLVEALLLLPGHRLKKVFREFLEKASKRQRDTLLRVIDHVVYRHRYSHANAWIEARLRKDPSLEPRTVAWSYLKTVGGSRRMFPWLLVLARRAKDRLRKRITVREDAK